MRRYISREREQASGTLTSRHLTVDTVEQPDGIVRQLAAVIRDLRIRAAAPAQTSHALMPIVRRQSNTNRASTLMGVQALAPDIVHRTSVRL